MSDRQEFHRYLQSRGIPSDLFQQDEAGTYEFATVEHDWEVWSAAQVGTSGASAERERDWESNCDECAGTGKVDVSEALHVDGRYMGDQLLRETCNTCTGYGFKVCLADIPKEIQQEAAARPAPHVNVQLAYGYLWHVNNEPGTPAPMYSPEKAAYKARHYLSALMTHEERGIAINAVRGLLGGSDE